VCHSLVRGGSRPHEPMKQRVPLSYHLSSLRCSYILYTRAFLRAGEVPAGEPPPPKPPSRRGPIAVHCASAPALLRCCGSLLWVWDSSSSSAGELEPRMGNCCTHEGENPTTSPPPIMAPPVMHALPAPTSSATVSPMPSLPAAQKEQEAKGFVFAVHPRFGCYWCCRHRT